MTIDGGIRSVPIRWPDRALSALRALGALIASLALLDLAVRSVVRLEARGWDTFLYHIPFAALRGRLPIPFQMNDAPEVQGFYEGFPPLPELVQGILWRLTGSMNATGVVNYLAFALFLVFCHVKLNARFWLVTLIALTAPMVLIHASVSYVDLFGNAFLAIGASALACLYLFDRHEDRALLISGLPGLTAAAWSKFLMAPLAAVFFAAFAVLYLIRARGQGRRWSVELALVFIAALLAAVPYAKNWAVYRNPFWPVKIPVVGEWLPYKIDMGPATAEQKPAALAHLGQCRLFFRSLFDNDLPGSSESGPRWTLDQGGARTSFGMGGFWNVSAAFYLAAAAGMALLFNGRKGAGLIAGGALLLALVACLPQSHLLRHYLFLPLCWAATVAMLFEPLSRRYVRAASCCLLAFMGLFLYMGKVNRAYYRIEKAGYREAARAWGADSWWRKLKPGMSYCVVDMEPIGILMTGPTLSEFHIIARSDRKLCPKDAVAIYNPIEEALKAIRDDPSPENYLALSQAYYAAGYIDEGILAAREALKLRPAYAEAYNSIGAAYAGMNRWDEAIDSLRAALRVDPDFKLAKENLHWALAQKKAARPGAAPRPLP